MTKYDRILRREIWKGVQRWQTVHKVGRILTLLSNVLPLHFRVLVLVFIGEYGTVFVTGFGLKPAAERGWDSYASSLLVGGYGRSCFGIQGTEGIERSSRWGGGWDPIH